MIWAAARRAPSSEYLLKLDQPAIIRPTTPRPAHGEEVEQAQVHVLGEQARARRG